MCRLWAAPSLVDEHAHEPPTWAVPGAPGGKPDSQNNEVFALLGGKESLTSGGLLVLLIQARSLDTAVIAAGLVFLFEAERAGPAVSRVMRTDVSSRCSCISSRDAWMSRLQMAS